MSEKESHRTVDQCEDRETDQMDGGRYKKVKEIHSEEKVNERQMHT